jgi:cysteine-rich repeat protein
MMLLGALLALGCAETVANDFESEEDEDLDAGDTADDEDTDTGTGPYDPPDDGEDQLCGNGIIDNAEEECDGDSFPEDNTCTSEGYFAGELDCTDDCEIDYSDCHNCGDGVWQEAEGEECDLGELNGDNAGCNTECEAAYCGDGLLWDDADAGPFGDAGPEECDDGYQNGDNSDCTEACQEAFCGDGLVWNEGIGEEVCDDGVNDASYGGCGEDCLTMGPYCGDVIVQEEFEDCDDGNESDNDDCLTDCTAPYCGDGIVWNEGSGEEECDDENEIEGDGCGPDCNEEYCGDDLVGWSRIEEGFESGDLAALPWVTGTEVGMDGPFAITTTPAPHGGSYMIESASPPEFPDDSRAYIQITLDSIADDQICFWYSGDIGFFSAFRFSVDDTVHLDTNSALPIEWTELCADVPAGSDHVYLWEHEVDWMDPDAVVYIDDVTFPLRQEECDDGNNESDDGCSSLCEDET